MIKVVGLAGVWVLFIAASVFNGLDYYKHYIELQGGALKGPLSPYWPGTVAGWVAANTKNRNDHLLFEACIVLCAVAASVWLGWLSGEKPTPKLGIGNSGR